MHIMGHSDIGVTMNVYTHLGLEDAEEEHEEETPEAEKDISEEPDSEEDE